MAYRILHVADVHLDAAFAGLTARAGSRRRDQLRLAFERALGLVAPHSVDAVCIAGDLYEDGRSGPDRATYLRRVLGDLAPVRIFIAPGNHDPLTPSSVYRQMSPLPDNVVIFGRRRFAPATLADGITLWGFGHERVIDRDPAFADFSCDGPGTHLLLFHGSDRDSMPPGKEAIAPFSAGDVVRSGAAYAMVGHFHGMLERPRHAYPGSPEPLNFTQDGRHTASIVTVDDGRVSAEFVDVNRVRYVDDTVDVSGYGDKAALEAALAQRLARLVDAPGEVFPRLRLVGEAQSTLDFDAPGLEGDLAERFEGLIVVDDVAAFDLDALAREGRTVRAEFVRAMLERIDAAADADRPGLRQALRYGLLAFADRSLPA